MYPHGQRLRPAWLARKMHTYYATSAEDTQKGMSAHVNSVDSDSWPFPNRDCRNNESFTLKSTEYGYSLFDNFNDFNHLHFIVPWLPSCRTPENEAPWCNYPVEFFDLSF